VVALDLDSSHQGSDQRLLASPIQIVQPIPHPGGELFEATDHQGQLTLGFGFVHSRLALLFEPDPARFQARDARLELIRLKHALRITVDQAPYSALKTRDLALQLQHILGSIGVSLRLRQAPAIFSGHAIGIFQERTDPFPDGLFQHVAPDLGIVAHRMAIKPRAIGANAAIVAIHALARIPLRRRGRLAIVGIAVWMRDLLGGSDDLEGWRQRV
jgi:hypothetical protein